MREVNAGMWHVEEMMGEGRMEFFFMTVSTHLFYGYIMLVTGERSSKVRGCRYWCWGVNTGAVYCRS